MDVPEIKLCFVKFNLDIFAVFYTEFNEDGLSSVIPLGSCWLPVKQMEIKPIYLKKHAEFKVILHFNMTLK